MRVDSAVLSSPETRSVGLGDVIHRKNPHLGTPLIEGKAVIDLLGDSEVLEVTRSTEQGRCPQTDEETVHLVALDVELIPREGDRCSRREYHRLRHRIERLLGFFFLLL